MVEELKTQMRKLENLIGCKVKVDVTSRFFTKELIQALDSKYKTDLENSMRLHRLEFYRELIENARRKQRKSVEAEEQFLLKEDKKEHDEEESIDKEEEEFQRPDDVVVVQPEDMDEWKDLMTLSRIYYVMEHPNSEGLKWKRRIAKKKNISKFSDKDLIEWRTAQNFRLRRLEEWALRRNEARKLAEKSPHDFDDLLEDDDSRELENMFDILETQKQKKRAISKLEKVLETKRPFRFTDEGMKDWTESYSDDSEESGTEDMFQDEVLEIEEELDLKIGEYRTSSEGSSVDEEKTISEIFPSYQEIPKYRNPILEEMDKAESIDRWFALCREAIQGERTTYASPPQIVIEEEPEVIEEPSETSEVTREESSATFEVTGEEPSATFEVTREEPSATSEVTGEEPSAISEVIEEKLSEESENEDMKETDGILGEASEINDVNFEIGSSSSDVEFQDIPKEDEDYLDEFRGDSKDAKNGPVSEIEPDSGRQHDDLDRLVIPDSNPSEISVAEVVPRPDELKTDRDTTDDTDREVSSLTAKEMDDLQEKSGDIVEAALSELPRIPSKATSLDSQLRMEEQQLTHVEDVDDETMVKEDEDYFDEFRGDSEDAKDGPVSEIEPDSGRQHDDLDKLAIAESNPSEKSVAEVVPRQDELKTDRDTTDDTDPEVSSLTAKEIDDLQEKSGEIVDKALSELTHVDVDDETLVQEEIPEDDKSALIETSEEKKETKGNLPFKDGSMDSMYRLESSEEPLLTLRRSSYEDIEDQKYAERGSNLTSVDTDDDSSLDEKEEFYTPKKPDNTNKNLTAEDTTDDSETFHTPKRTKRSDTGPFSSKNSDGFDKQEMAENTATGEASTERSSSEQSMKNPLIEKNISSIIAEATEVYSKDDVKKSDSESEEH